MEPAPRSWSLVVELVTLSVWLGAALLFAAVVAPAVFAVLPSRTTAGDIVGRVLPALLWAGLVISLLVGLLEAVAQNATFTANWRAGMSLLVGLACVWALLIGQRIDKLRASIGQPIDALPTTDPRRVDFGRLHALSVAVLGVAILGALGLAVSVARRLVGRNATRRTFQTKLEPSHHV
jgi:hypothetical protein